MAKNNKQKEKAEFFSSFFHSPDSSHYPHSQHVLATCKKKIGKLRSTLNQDPEGPQVVIFCGKSPYLSLLRLTPARD